MIGSTTRAQEKTPIPSFTGERVIVRDVPDRYGVLADQITRLEKSSPQSYYVVVVKSTGQGSSATRDYADELYDTWRRQGANRGRSFDPERSVIIVVALENRQVAVKPGTDAPEARSARGSGRARSDRQLSSTWPKESRYTEAISALLDETNNWIAARDSETPYVAVQVAASKAAVVAVQVREEDARKSPPLAPKPAVSSPPGTDRSLVQAEPAPPKQASSEWLPVDHRGGADPALSSWPSWPGSGWFRRAQGRVAGRIKEIKSKAADVMDRLDALKERLKLMPTSTDFKQPMTGETQALYNAVNDRLGKLWDGWLHVMDVLEKAQKLAARSGSPLSQKTLAEAEELINKQGSFAEIETQAQAISADVDRLDHAHQVARAVLEAVTAPGPRSMRGSTRSRRLGLPTAPYQEELGAVAAGMTQASTVLARRSAGDHGRPGTASVAVGRLPGPDRARRVALWRCAKGQVIARDDQAPGGRASGARVEAVEDGGNPDPLLGQGEGGPWRDHDRARGRRSRRRRQKLDAAKSMAQEAQATIDKVQKARAFCERDLPARARNRAAPHGLAPGRVVSKRPRARVCPIVVASGGAQPRPGPRAPGDLRPPGRAGRGGRDHDETRILKGGRARRRAGPPAADRAPVDVGPGRAAQCAGQCPQRVQQAQRRPGGAASGRRSS